ncbi:MULTISPECIES: homoserine kinase [Actinokineospora]|uniref:Homoserine kinase n=1 Tax=Actinokineospora fastidiosa TaxID=1816 RepID=A0A918GPX6_9PSEU|nr:MULTISPECIES: homoserine kinase [Actinokineospora]UVS81398.1 Homoserine kinase [Actinokineospora sp. UTMC 2448]GGS53287.1 homoserine kinase [Actinokineospora fastidiosa]
MSAGVRVRVPASTANLGSGFDALGMALGRYDEVVVRPAPATAVRVVGEGAGEVALDERHLVLRAMRAAAAKLGSDPGPVELVCENTIPHARGLGSSAAAIVAGIAAAYGLAGRPLDDDALHLAAEFEGHADNVAASLLGGLVVAWHDADGFRAARLEPHPDLRAFAIVPDTRSDTHVTRGLLPERVPHADAAFAAGRAALAVHAVTAAPELLLPATADRLHQDYRESAYPATLGLVRDLRARGVAAAVSGAGPTVLALCTSDSLPDGLELGGFTVWPLGIDRAGVVVETM